MQLKHRSPFERTENFICLEGWQTSTITPQRQTFISWYRRKSGTIPVEDSVVYAFTTDKKHRKGIVDLRMACVAGPASSRPKDDAVTALLATADVRELKELRALLQKSQVRLKTINKFETTPS